MKSAQCCATVETTLAKLRVKFFTMKTYSWRSGSLSQGLSVADDEKLGKIIYLGEFGRGRRYEKVGLLRKDPAEIIDGKILEAHPVKITVNRGTDKERSFFVLAKPNAEQEKDKRVLVRIDTSYTYTRGTAGGWKTKAGSPQELIKGYGAHGIAGRIGNWDDGLVLVAPGDVLRIKPEGGYKSSAYALFFDENGELATMVWEDYEAMQAIENASDEGGEVEWL